MGLTDIKIKNLALRKKVYEVSDGNGLAIRVTPKGTKSWVYRYQFEGRARRMTLGRYPGISLAKAREKHGIAMMDLQRGIDPGEQLQIDKANRKAAPTFSDLLDEFWDNELKSSPSGKERKRLVKKDALPKLATKKVTDISRRDVALILDSVRKRAPVTANRLLGVLVRMFNFACEQGIIEHSPILGMRRYKEKPCSRVLSDDEIKKLWFALDLGNKDIDIYRLTKLAIKMVLLTGQRPGEVCGMTRDEIEEEFWIIPENRTKNQMVQRVPLCEMAKDILEQAKLYSSNCKHVFKSSHKKNEPVSTHALSKAVARHLDEFGIKEKFTPQDLRRTVRTKLSELGVDDNIAERVLGHKLQGVKGTYNRYKYDKEKREALLLWESHLHEILKAEGNSSDKNQIDADRNLETTVSEENTAQITVNNLESARTDLPNARLNNQSNEDYLRKSELLKKIFDKKSLSEQDSADLIYYLMGIDMEYSINKKRGRPPEKNRDFWLAAESLYRDMLNKPQIRQPIMKKYDIKKNNSSTYYEARERGLSYFTEVFIKIATECKNNHMDISQVLGSALKMISKEELADIGCGNSFIKKWFEIKNILEDNEKRFPNDLDVKFSLDLGIEKLSEGFNSSDSPNLSVDFQEKQSRARITLIIPPSIKQTDK